MSIFPDDFNFDLDGIYDSAKKKVEKGIEKAAIHTTILTNKTEEFIKSVGREMKSDAQALSHTVEEAYNPKSKRNGGDSSLLPKSKAFSAKNDKFLKTLAICSAMSYGSKDFLLPSGCVICEEHQTSSGLNAKLFQIYNGNYVCAFAGTNSARDCIEDLTQCLGLSTQFEDALRYGKSVMDRYSTDVIFTGHSQGGGEAAYCAFALGLRAYTFNPAGLSRFTTSKISKRDIERADVHSYIFGQDMLNTFQDTLSLVSPLLFNIKADGNVHYVTDYNPKDFSVSELHGISGILRYFDV